MAFILLSRYSDIIFMSPIGGILSSAYPLPVEDHELYSAPESICLLFRRPIYYSLCNFWLWHQLSPSCSHDLWNWTTLTMQPNAQVGSFLPFSANTNTLCPIALSLPCSNRIKSNNLASFLYYFNLVIGFQCLCTQGPYVWFSSLSYWSDLSYFVIWF